MSKFTLDEITYSISLSSSVPLLMFSFLGYFRFRSKFSFPEIVREIKYDFNEKSTRQFRKTVVVTKQEKSSWVAQNDYETRNGKGEEHKAITAWSRSKEEEAAGTPKVGFRS